VARAVLDSSAIVALILAEPGSDLIADYVGDAIISTVNLQEVIKILLLRGMREESIRIAFAGIGLVSRAHGERDAWAAASLYDATKAKGCGLGDRSCMALAIAEGLPALTTDRVWADLAIPGLTVIVAR
jgi:PIN domain nuclease of toxin-antitoxin system